jgi:hypothetical protein
VFSAGVWRAADRAPTARMQHRRLIGGCDATMCSIAGPPIQKELSCCTRVILTFTRVKRADSGEHCRGTERNRAA